MDKVEDQVAALAAYKDAMVPGNVKAAMKSVDAKSSDLWRVPLAQLVLREGYNPRIESAEFLAGLDRLAQDIAKHGYHDDKPISVIVSNEEGKDVLVVENGNRRTRAARIAVEKYGASLETLPVVPLPRSMSAEKRLVHMVKSNNEGVPFTPLELAVVVQRLEGYGWDVDTIAKELGVTPTRITQLQTLASSPAEIREFVKNGTISATLAIETVQQEGSGAAELIKEAVDTAKKAGKKATAKTVKAVKATKKKGKPSNAELAAKSVRMQKKHAEEAFMLLKAVFDKNGKHIDDKFHREVDALFVQCGIIG
jgi:ParB family chromosome partitioning protein